MKRFALDAPFRKGSNAARSLGAVATSALALLALTLGSVVFVRAGGGDPRALAEDEPRIVESTESVPVVPDAEFPEEPAVKNSDVPVGWIPDLRVLAGAPTATVDLSECERKFRAQNNFDAKAQIEWSLVQNSKPDVADVKIVGDKLYVHWKEGAIGSTKIVAQATQVGDETRRASAAFNAETWAPNYLQIAMAVLGGLGLFLLGMKNMSDGLTAIAGSRLRRLISLFTNNRFLAVGVGIVTTTLLQSSSATSVMTMGFVNSGLMTLKQAMGVIIGAHIGTTTTGWLIAFKVGALGLPLLGLAAMTLIFVKREKVRNFATFALGLGMIFFGLEVLKQGMSPLSDLPQFGAFLQSFAASGSLVNVGKCIFVGAVVTMLVQSSAVTLALVITLATLGTIDLNSSAAIVLGSNAGTTITAWLASLGSDSNGRRAAYFHIFSNVFGVLWFWPLFFVVLMPLVHKIGAMCGMTTDVSKIALTHTIFNVGNTIVLLPLIGPISRVLNRWVKDDSSPKKKQSATGLEAFVNDEPVIGVERSRLEVQRMFVDCRNLFFNLSELQKNQFEDETLVEKSFQLEQVLDDVQDETIDFVSKLTTKTFSADLASSAREQIRLAEELETIGDYLVGVLKSNLKLKNAGLSLPEAIREKSVKFLGDALESLQWLETSFERRRHGSLVGRMVERRAVCVKQIKAARDTFVQEMFEQKCDPLVIVAVDYQLNAWRRTHEHLLNIAEAMELPGQTSKR
ncbi:MAG: Na/Pi cotransporter family protein [Thermoguttaceae bacterium]|nr:Na/Pi cotransporter family protein [Thermoguttaceae bacterium]